jgi:hypothetical protein
MPGRQQVAGDDARSGADLEAARTRSSAIENCRRGDAALDTGVLLLRQDLLTNDGVHLAES